MTTPWAIWLDQEALARFFDVYDFVPEFPFLVALGKPLEDVIYIFAKRHEYLDEWEALYIGESDSLRTRLSGHEKLDDAIDLGLTHIHVMYVADTGDVRRQIEQSLIARYRPPLNDLSPSTT